MAEDDLRNDASPRIAVTEERDIRFWMERLSVDEAHLRMAIAEVGDDARDVAEYLAGAAAGT